MGGGSYRSYNYSSSATKRSASYYAKRDNREYKRPQKGLPSPVGVDIKSESEHSLVFILDVTGSMQDWPRLILEKMPTLYVETNNTLQGITPEYAEKNKNKVKEVLDISIIAIGDERQGDLYPIQVTDFTQYEGLQEKIKSVYPEGGGGGNARESYDLAVYFATKHCKTKDKKPICIIAGDEGFYDYINPREIKNHIGDTIDEKINTEHTMEQLKNKFETYVLRKDYSERHEKRINDQWRGVFGDRVIKMSNPKRLVDAAIVAAAHSQGHLDMGMEWIKRRQTEQQVTEIEESFKQLTTKINKKRNSKKNLDNILEELHPFRKRK